MANAVFPLEKSNAVDTDTGFNQTVYYNEAKGSYYGSMYVGTPL